MKILLNTFRIHKKIFLLSIAVILSVSNFAQGAEHHDFADRVITSAKVYTVNPEQPWAEAIAIKDGRIIYVGDNSGLKKWIFGKMLLIFQISFLIIRIKLRKKGFINLLSN